MEKMKLSEFKEPLDWAEKNQLVLIPINPSTKKPIGDWAKFQKVRSNRRQWEQWLNEGHILAIMLGHDNLIGIDIDDYELAAALYDLNKLAAKGVMIVNTPNGGVHIYQRGDEPVPAKTFKLELKNGVEKSENPHKSHEITIRCMSKENQPSGYFIMPGMKLNDGRKYELHPGVTWNSKPEQISGGPDAIAEFERRLAHQITKTNYRLKTKVQHDLTQIWNGSSRGDRHHSLCIITSAMKIVGIPEAIAVKHMLGWNKRNEPPKRDDEIQKVVEDLYSREAYNYSLTEPPKIAVGKILGENITAENEETVTIKRLQPTYKTAHLNHFETLKNIYTLRGNHYLPHIKAEYYSLQSIGLPKKTVSVGDIYADLRLPVLHPIKSGGGKKNIQYGNKLIVEKLEKKFESPTSLHQEQLLGKVLRRGKGKGEKWVKNLGYFSADYISFDEMISLFIGKDKDAEITRGYLRQATDAYGKNEVRKSSVNNLDTEEERIKYCPHFICNAFLQPIPFPESIITEGTFRRFVVPYSSIKNAKAEDFRRRLRSKNMTKQAVETFASHLNKISDIGNINLTFSSAALDWIEKCHLALLEQGRAHSEKGRNYTCLVEFWLQDKLIKFSCLLALSLYRSEVNDIIVKLAYLDLAELWACELNFILAKVQGNLDYGETWRAQDVREEQILKWLWDNNGREAKTSTVKITAFLDTISEIYNVRMRTARYHLSKFRKRGLVATEQVGQHDSKVWLCFKPEIENSGWQEGKDGTSYTKILSEYPSLLKSLGKLNISNVSEAEIPVRPLPSLQPLQPSQSKVNIENISTDQKTPPPEAEELTPPTVGMQVSNITTLLPMKFYEIRDKDTLLSFMRNGESKPVSQEDMEKRCDPNFDLPSWLDTYNRNGVIFQPRVRMWMIA